MPTKLKTNDRPHAGGRPPKLNKSEYGQITCVLPLFVIEQLKAGAASKHFGEFLECHLRRHPLPTREQYLSLRHSTPYYTMIKRKKVPTLMASGSGKAARKLARERARREKMTPEERAWEDSIREAVTKTVEATYK